MTEIMPANSPPGDAEELPSVVVSNSSSPKANGVEANGENGDGERPVREKLKKTSIAQFANGTTPPGVADEEFSKQPRTLAADCKQDTPMEDGVDVPGKSSRLLSKRPLPEAEESSTLSPDVMDITTNGHARKRSRDERLAETTEVVEEQSDISSEPMDADGQKIQEVTSEDAQFSEKPRAETTTFIPPNAEPIDEEMKEQILSPRKKRSRDQFEAESQERDQKVAATEETRSRRRSVELKRSRSPEEPRDVSHSKGTELDSTREELAADKVIDTDSKVYSYFVYTFLPRLTCLIQFSKELNSNSASSTSSEVTVCSPSPSKDASSARTFGQSTRTSPDAFAASGFAVLANASTSPFGSLASSKPQQDSSTKSSSASIKSSSPPTNAVPTANTSDSKQRVFGSATPIIPLAKENTKQSTFGPPLTSFASSQPSGGFGSLGASGFGSLTSTQGSAFSSSPFGGGPKKLSSFAAPTGDAKLGSTTTVTAKPFGAPAEGDESDEGSEARSDEDEDKRADEKKEKKERDGVVDPRFHKQESKSSRSFTSKPKRLDSTKISQHGMEKMPKTRSSYPLEVSSSPLPKASGRSEVPVSLSSTSCTLPLRPKRTINDPLRASSCAPSLHIVSF